jgi:uncharacterized membrane protein
MVAAMNDPELGSPPHAAPDHRLERLVFFSDAVFAIAITLLVIEIHVPHLHDWRSDAEGLRALAALIPSFIGFFVSFFVIGAFWAGHHRAMALAGHWTERLFMPNLVLLSAVAAVPFFTAFASANPFNRVAATAYALWLLAVALCNLRLQRIVTNPPVVAAAAEAGHIARLRRRGLAVALGSASAAVVSLLYPPLGQVTLATIPLWRKAIEYRDGRRRRGS